MSNKSRLQTNNTNLQALIDKANALPDAGSSGGGSVETCTVTITQVWGMNDDPEMLYLHIPYYNILSDGDIEKGYIKLTSAQDSEPEHSITFTVVKNMPIFILFYSISENHDRIIITSDNGTVEDVTSSLDEVGIINSKFMSLTPTADTATFTFSSP